MKILIHTNILTAVDAASYIAHIAFWGSCIRDFPKAEFIAFTPPRCSIDTGRNNAARIALENECDYLMFLDDDVLPQAHTLKSLIEANQDIVMAETYIRGYPFAPMFFKVINEDERNPGLDHYWDFKENIDSDGLVPCAAVGFSCALIKCDVLKRITPPYFFTGTHHTEDVYFCIKAAQSVPNLKIAVDTKMPTLHLYDKIAVSAGNVEKLRKFAVEIEGATPHAKFTDEVSEDEARGNNYLKSIMEVVDISNVT